MGLKDTVSTMKSLLNEISSNLEKAADGNKAASQRVRTGSIRLEKVAKTYRKESVASEKKVAKPKAAKSASKSAAKKSVKSSAKKSTKTSKKKR